MWITSTRSSNCRFLFALDNIIVDKVLIVPTDKAKMGHDFSQNCRHDRLLRRAEGRRATTAVKPVCKEGMDTYGKELVYNFEKGRQKCESWRNGVLVEERREEEERATRKVERETADCAGIVCRHGTMATMCVRNGNNRLTAVDEDKVDILWEKHEDIGEANA